jgi:hypothetical protein
LQVDFGQVIWDSVMSPEQLFDGAASRDDPEAAGSGGQSCFDADWGVFEDDAAGRRDAEPGGCF